MLIYIKSYAIKEHDKETGLYYLNARMYDPKIARFLQEDTYTGEQDDPLSLNLYTYCSNEPLMYTDPTGHWQEGDENLTWEAQWSIESLTLQYKEAKTPEEKARIAKEASEIRNNPENKAVKPSNDSTSNSSSVTIKPSYTEPYKPPVTQVETPIVPQNVLDLGRGPINNETAIKIVTEQNNTTTTTTTTPVSTNTTPSISNTSNDKKDSNDVEGKEHTQIGSNNIASPYYAQIYKERQAASKEDARKWMFYSYNNILLDNFMNEYYTGEVTLTILVDQPVPGSLNPLGGDGFGHAFIRLEYYEGSSRIIKYIGFYPSAGTSDGERFFGVEGFLRDDNNHRWNIGKIYKISYESAKKIVNEVIPQYENGRTWSALGTNCIDFAQDSLKVATGKILPGEAPSTFGENIRVDLDYDSKKDKYHKSYIYLELNGKESYEKSKDSIIKVVDEYYNKK
ncbi:MAG TPA: RHS repeat-associated core domain-containing protein [Pseudobacteroides sp.]